MEQIYILSRIYTSENSASLVKTTLYQTYPHVAGTKEGVEKELNRIIEITKSEGLSVEEITSESVHAGHYFNKVVKMQQKLGGPAIYGIHSVWKVN